MDMNDTILGASQIIVNAAIEKAGYDRTIQAEILSCEDATIGKYRCRYQDATIYAYASSSDVSFTNGSYVYILVPGNNMSAEKTILGTTKKLGINYISQAVGDQAYNIIGSNCIDSTGAFYLDTANKDYKYTLYDVTKTDQSISIDAQGLNEYIKQSSSLIVGATFKTSIIPQRQYRGHYGITYTLRFRDNTSNNEVLRSYTVDEDNMVDNPYRLVYHTRQYQIFEIDGPNFIRLQSIEIFNKDFPGATGTKTGTLLTAGDIEITKLEITGAIRMSQQEIDGVAISFYTPQGTFFTEQSPTGSYKTVTAQVRVKGKLVSAAQNIPFYWGIQNVGITSRSQYYNKYVGRGWKCLNDKNIISKGTATSDPVIEWVPSKDTFIMKINEATARQNKLRVAIVYDGTVVTKEIVIKNLAAKVPVLTIESSGGTKFYYDIGHPTLTCLVNGAVQDNYQYTWAYQNNTGVLESLPQTTTQNTNYQKVNKTLDDLKKAIANGTKFPNAQKENLANAETAVKAFDFIQRVKGNTVYNAQISNITQFGVYKCSVTNANGIYLGTCSITLTNSLNGEDIYSLVINNGAVTYQYNENGVAPNNKSLDIPQQIQGLSFTVYDNLGNEIDNSIILNDSKCKVRWQLPIKDTMLQDDASNGESAGTDPTLTYKYYDNKLNLVYGIVQKYDIKKQRNQIKLTVDYKGMNLTAETNFTFAKQGQPGTNGTQYLVKLVPRTLMAEPPLWPMITKAGSSYILNYGLGSDQQETTIGVGTGYKFFKAQLWRSGELVWQGQSIADPAKDNITHPTVVNWQMLSNTYYTTSSGSAVKDASSFTITADGSKDGTIKYNGDTLQYYMTTPYANIVKCSITWQDKTYYGTIPITTAWTYGSDYRIKLKDYTGWRYAVYTSDGVSPQYDSSHPFEFIMERRISTYDSVARQYKYTWQDVSLLQSGRYATQVPTIGAIGNYKNNTNGSTTNANLIQILGLRNGSPDEQSVYRKDCQKNQWMARPASRYDGVCVNAAITCIYRTYYGTIIGRISVPIHFLLNKYGLSHINAWDGNSIQIDDEGGFILSPQMGAGTKNSDNSFTGVLMGEVRNAGKSNPDVGLLGYYSGDRTFFLNSKNGSAFLGRTGMAQIIIDPSQVTKGLIYSGNFWKNTAYNKETGLPNYGNYEDTEFYKNYRSATNYKPAGNAKGQGLIIDLTTPQIYFGNGNFCVTSNGYIHASGGGDIAGWNIGTEQVKNNQGQVTIRSVLYSNVTKNNGRITLDAGTMNTTTGVVTGPGKIYSYSHDSLTQTGNGFYLSMDGLSIGGMFKVDNTGKMYIGKNATSKGGISGQDDGKYYWTINADTSRAYISYGGNTSYSAAVNTDETTNTPDSKYAKVYLGTDGISIGRRFSVNNEGYLTAYKGTIGGWNLDKNSFYSGTKDTGTSAGYITLRSSGTFTRSINGTNRNNLQFAIGSQFGVTNSGKLYCSGAEMSGTVNATGGKIAGWTIDGNKLKAEAYGYTYDNNGQAHYEKAYEIGVNGATYYAEKAFYIKGYGNSTYYPFYVTADGAVKAESFTCEWAAGTGGIVVDIGYGKWYSYPFWIGYNSYNGVGINDQGVNISYGYHWAQFTMDGVLGSDFSISYDDTSDVRLKTNIKDLDSSLAKSIRPVSFEFIKEKGRTRYGFIAQEVQKIVPSAIVKRGDGYLCIHSSQLIAPLYALVQQQQKTIESLESRLQKLEKRIK